MSYAYILRGIVLALSSLAIIFTIALLASDKWYTMVVSVQNPGFSVLLEGVVGPFQMCEKGHSIFGSEDNCASLLSQCGDSKTPPVIKAYNNCSILVGSMVTIILAFVCAVIGICFLIAELIFRRHPRASLLQFIGISVYILSTIFYFVTFIEVVAAYMQSSVASFIIPGGGFGTSFYLCVVSAAFMMLSSLMYVVCAIMRSLRFNVLFVSSQLRSPLISTSSSQVPLQNLSYQPPQASGQAHQQRPPSNGQPQYPPPNNQAQYPNYPAQSPYFAPHYPYPPQQYQNTYPPQQQQQNAYPPQQQHPNTYPPQHYPYPYPPYPYPPYMQPPPPQQQQQQELQPQPQQDHPLGEVQQSQQQDHPLQGLQPSEQQQQPMQ